MRPLLDTHIWLWWIGDERHLSKREMASLDELPAEQRPFISDISLWEVAVLLELGRWNVAIPFESWLKAACHPRTVEILPISQDIAAEVVRLPATFHRDPADRIIVSTARARDIPLFTRDRRILDARLTKKWVM
jgi:PIN domain nuclease of toxin-antitoxin system